MKSSNSYQSKDENNDKNKKTAPRTIFDNQVCTQASTTKTIASTSEDFFHTPADMMSAYVWRQRKHYWSRRKKAEVATVQAHGKLDVAKIFLTSHVKSQRSK